MESVLPQLFKVVPVVDAALLDWIRDFQKCAVRIRFLAEHHLLQLNVTDALTRSEHWPTNDRRNRKARVVVSGKTHLKKTRTIVANNLIVVDRVFLDHFDL